MRIISGIHKGRRVIKSKKLPVRPTTDMAKEALFNIINNHYYFDDISVLDLYAGTGNISYEFASRGTPKITAVDANFGCIQFITKIAETFKMPITTFKSDAIQYLENNIQKHSIIFADPPYKLSLESFAKIPRLVFKNELLEDRGMLIIEHSKHTDLSSVEQFSYTKLYGGNRFSFFK